MKFLKDLVRKVILAIIMNLLSPVVIIITSKVKTGNWLELYKNPVVIILSIILLIWFIASLIYRGVDLKKNRNSSFFIPIEIPLYGWRPIAEITYRNVRWIIQYPVNSINERNIQTDKIEAKTTAICPNCKLELEEKENFFGRFKWTCISCGFSKTNKDSMFDESERAARLAKREFEKEKEKSYN